VDELRKAGGSVSGIAADVGTDEGRTLTLRQALDALGALDILVNNAGGVRADRIAATSQSEIEAMLNVDLLAPILLTRAALLSLRAGGDAMVVNVTWGIALIGARHLRRCQGGSCPIRRSPSTRVEGRRRPCPDGLSGQHRHTDDADEPGRTGTRLP